MTATIKRSLNLILSYRVHLLYTSKIPR